MAGGCWGVNQSSRIIRLEGVLLVRQGSLYTASVVDGMLALMPPFSHISLLSDPRAGFILG